MGLTGLGVAVMQATLGEGPWQEVAANLIYPIGFIAVNHVRAGDAPPKRLPLAHFRSGYEQRPDGFGESSKT